MNRLEARVHGLVQGVGYRFFVVRHARRLGLAGFVRNLADGSVEVAAEGEMDSLKELLRLLSIGPPGSKVDSIDEKWCCVEGSHKTFEITH